MAAASCPTSSLSSESSSDSSLSSSFGSTSPTTSSTTFLTGSTCVSSTRTTGVSLITGSEGSFVSTSFVNIISLPIITFLIFSVSLILDIE